MPAMYLHFSASEKSPGNRRSLTQEFKPVKPLGTPRATFPCFLQAKTCSVSCRAAPLSRRHPNPRDTNTQNHPPPHGSGFLLVRAQPCKPLSLIQGNTL